MDHFLLLAGGALRNVFDSDFTLENRWIWYRFVTKIDLILMSLGPEICFSLFLANLVMNVSGVVVT